MVRVISGPRRVTAGPVGRPGLASVACGTVAMRPRGRLCRGRRPSPRPRLWRRDMYPISYEADPALEGRNRLTSFFRYIVAIPWLIVAYIYGIVAEIAAIIAWFAIVFTGKYPEGLYNFNAGYLRMSSRTNSFMYLLTDEFPA